MTTVLRTSQFDRWLARLKDNRGKARILHRVRAAERGNVGDCKALGNGVFELRIHSGPGYRVYCARKGEMTIVLLCGGTKSGQRRDIAVATQLARALKQD